jgi:hypothetical protein
MHENRKAKLIATVSEEPTSSQTTNRQINKGTQEETRNTGKRVSCGENRKEQPGSAMENRDQG